MENKIYTEKTRKLWQNIQKIANFLRYYGKIHSKLPIFRVKSVKIYTGQKKVYTGAARGARDKYEVSLSSSSSSHSTSGEYHFFKVNNIFQGEYLLFLQGEYHAPWQKEKAVGQSNGISGTTLPYQGVFDVLI